MGGGEPEARRRVLGVAEAISVIRVAGVELRDVVSCAALVVVGDGPRWESLQAYGRVLGLAEAEVVEVFTVWKRQCPWMCWENVRQAIICRAMGMPWRPEDLW